MPWIIFFHGRIQKILTFRQHEWFASSKVVHSAQHQKKLILIVDKSNIRKNVLKVDGPCSKPRKIWKIPLNWQMVNSFQMSFSSDFFKCVFQILFRSSRFLQTLRGYFQAKTTKKGTFTSMSQNTCQWARKASRCGTFYFSEQQRVEVN